MPSSVYDFEAIAEVLRRGKPKAQAETPIPATVTVWCQICGLDGWKFIGNGQYVVCPLCQNANGKPNPSRSMP